MASDRELVIVNLMIDNLTVPHNSSLACSNFGRARSRFVGLEEQWFLPPGRLAALCLLDGARLSA